MAIRTVWFYPVETFSYVDPNLFNNINIATGKTGYTLTVGQKATPQSFVIDDTDSRPGTLDDRPLIGAGNQAQKLTEATTINGIEYPAGTSVGLGYGLGVSGSDGSTNFLAAMVINGTVVGFVATNEQSNTVPGWQDHARPLKPGVTYKAVSGAGSTDNPHVGYDYMAYCFARDTLILTNRGQVPVQELAIGDLVQTRDNGLQPIRWIGRRLIDDLAENEKLRPIRISAGALGQSQPTADLVVSPQHRVLVRSRIAQRIFGAEEVLVAAKQLCQIEEIDILDIAQVEYFHLLFDRHEIVYSNGAETESLFTGPETLKAVGDAAREEIFAIFPELRDLSYSPVSARPMASGRMGRKLAVRHVQNGKPLLD